jgi:hypothetical protein
MSGLGTSSYDHEQYLATAEEDDQAIDEELASPSRRLGSQVFYSHVHILQTVGSRIQFLNETITQTFEEGYGVQLVCSVLGCF